jgi:hypothetical protein
MIARPATTKATPFTTSERDTLMLGALLPLLLGLTLLCAPWLFGLGLHFGLAYWLPAALAERRKEQEFREAKTELLADNPTSFHGCRLFLLGLPPISFLGA